MKFVPGRNFLNLSKYTGTYQNFIILKQKCISDFVVLASCTNTGGTLAPRLGPFLESFRAPSVYETRPSHEYFKPTFTEFGHV